MTPFAWNMDRGGVRWLISHVERELNESMEYMWTSVYNLVRCDEGLDVVGSQRGA